MYTSYQQRVLDSDPFATVYLRLDDKMLMSTRKSYGFFDWLAAIGGIAKSVMAVFGFISFFFSY